MIKRSGPVLLQLCFVLLASQAFAAADDGTFTCVGTMNPAASFDETAIQITPDQTTFTAKVRVSTVHTKMICGLKLVSDEEVSESQTAIGGGCAQARRYQTSLGELVYYHGDFANATLESGEQSIDFHCSPGTTDDYVKQLQQQQEN